MNPFGVAPPGMPYQERPLRDDEVDSQASSSEDEDEIAMPSGPPPPPDGEEFVTSDDEITLPDGAPPGQDPVPPSLPASNITPPVRPFLPPMTSTAPYHPASMASSDSRHSQVTFEAATVSAEPELRDFKKEATAFVPSSLKRKRPTEPRSESSRLNAAPTLTAEDTKADVTPARPDLLSTLRSQFGPPPDKSNM